MMLKFTAALLVLAAVASATLTVNLAERKHKEGKFNEVCGWCGCATHGQHAED